MYIWALGFGMEWEVFVEPSIKEGLAFLAEVYCCYESLAQFSVRILGDELAAPLGNPRQKVSV